MKISFLLPTPSLSGGIKVVAIYASELQKMGHTVVLVSPPSPPHSLKTKARNFLSWLVYRDKDTRPNELLSHLDSYTLDHRVLDKYRPIYDEDLPDADVVVATWWETAEWMGRLSASKGAHAYFIQGHEVFPYLPQDRVIATYLAPFYQITISNWLNKILASDYGRPADALVPNGVDHKQFFAPSRSKQHRPTIGFLYSQSSVKGVDTTLSALKQLRQEFPLLRILSFGSVSPSADNDWMQCIEFELSPAQSRLREIYAQCDIWVTASRSEGFNLTAMEAMACRTPVISTKTGWPDQAFKNYENGVLIDVDDVAGMVEACRNVLNLDEIEWKKLSNNATYTVSKSSWEQSAIMFEKALQNCIENYTTQEPLIRQ